MKNTYQLGLSILFSALFVGSAVAQIVAPPNVDNVQASVQDGKLVVTWDAVEDPAGISFYRLYYGRESIMDNGGNYDDFEQTADNQLTYTFPSLPSGPDVYVSVLAVNTGGMESDAFQSEAHVVLTAPASSSSEAQSSVTSAVSSTSSALPMGQFLLSKAEAKSLTGIILTFSHALDTTTQILPSDVIVLDQSGTQLVVTGVELIGAQMRLTTTPQTPEKKYIIATFGSAKDSQGNVAVTLKQIEFYGYMAGGMNSSPSATTDTTPPEDPTGLRLVPKLLSNGLYNVFSFWNPSKDTAKDLESYEVDISEGGLAYVRSGSLPATAREAKHENMKPGTTFGVRVKAKDAAGNESAGITKVITLPQSGLGLFGVVLVSGALAARRTARRKAEKGVE